MQYIRKFDNHEEYDNFVSGDTMVRPNVSRCMEDNDVHYNPKTFYVYHTSDCTIEKITVADNVTDFDIMSLVKSGYTYGGYFKEYLSKGTTADAILSGGSVEFIDGVVQDEGGSPYIGDLTVTSSTNPNRISYLNDPYLIDGRHMNPKDGVMYYLKEDIDGYLWNYTYSYPSTTGSTLTILLPMSAISNLWYNRAWFTIKEDDGEPFDVDTTVVSQITVKNASGQSLQTLRPGTVFRNKGLTTNRAYFMYIGFKTYDTQWQYVSEGHSYTIIPKVETADGVTIIGKKRVLTITSLDNGSAGLSADDTQD